MRFKLSQVKSAFSMLELVFVIVILGIVSSIGAEVIAKVYENYIIQRAVHRSSIKTELAATQLANRLAYSIPGTVIGRVNQSTFNAIENIPAGSTDRNILEWVGYDSDGFGRIKPSWSGYCNVEKSSKDTLYTPGSSLNDINETINNLSYSSITNTVIFFPDTYSVHDIGYSEVPSHDPLGVHKIKSNNGNKELKLQVRAGKPRTIKEHYKLAWTAYAIKPTLVTDQVARGFQKEDVLWDLTLYYDYQPWEGESYSSNGIGKLFLRNVSVFNFTGTGNTIRFKICQKESIGGEFSINTCKEKAVTR